MIPLGEIGPGDTVIVEGLLAIELKEDMQQPGGGGVGCGRGTLETSRD